MDIGTEKETVTIEPVEDPAKREADPPEPVREPEPVPVKEPARNLLTPVRHQGEQVTARQLAHPMAASR